MKEVMVSRVFPAEHSRKGEPTHFVEKIWAGLADLNYVMDDIDFSYIDFDFNIYYDSHAKWHTIRAGKRFVDGEEIQLKAWNGKPYRSKKTLFVPPLKINVFDFKMDFNGVPEVNGYYLEDKSFNDLCFNDGLSEEDFINWFHCHPKRDKDDWSFSGQILCWNEKILY